MGSVGVRNVSGPAVDTMTRTTGTRLGGGLSLGIDGVRRTDAQIVRRIHDTGLVLMAFQAQRTVLIVEDQQGPGTGSVPLRIYDMKAMAGEAGQFAVGSEMGPLIQQISRG